MRVISLLASGTEIVCELGAGDWLVGRSHECDNPSWVNQLPTCTTPAFDISMSSRQIDEEVRRRLKAGEPLYHVDTELINSLEPDLLITQAHCEVCAVTPGDVKRAGCVVAKEVLALQAGSLAGIFEGICSIGRALGREEQARELVRTMRTRIDGVNSAVKDRRAPSVVTLEWIDPIFAMGNWGPELVESANGRLLISEKGAYSAAIEWKQVRDADPDWLIVAPCGFDLNRTLRELPVLEALPGWHDLRSVREGQVALADGNKYFNRSGTTIVETAEIAAEILHGYAAGHRGKAWIDYACLGKTPSIRRAHAAASANDSPTYVDPVTGYDVFTADFLRRRGQCCESRCRHCPYSSWEGSSASPTEARERILPGSLAPRPFRERR